MVCFSSWIVVTTVLAVWHINYSTQLTDDDLLNKVIDSPEPNVTTTTTTEAPTTTTTTEDPNVNCVCVKYYLCDIDNGTVIDNGLGLIDTRVDVKANKTTPCKNDFEICCKVLKPENDTIVTARPNTEPKPTDPPVAEPKFDHTVCGKRHENGIGLRIEGPDSDTNTQFGEFPWMAAILRRKTEADKNSSNEFLCGGSLIHPKVVLTAAHCVFGKTVSEINVRLGAWDTRNANEAYPDVNRNISQIIIHKSFKPGTLFNDMALIIFDKETNFAPNIDTVCLSPNNFDMAGKRCFVTGWGKNSFEQGSYQVILKKIELPIIPHIKCQVELRKTRLGSLFRLHDSFVCAGGEEGKDACQGDGGSPLVCQIPNSPYYFQYGIVAWGIGCANTNPGVYVNVPKFLNWVSDNFLKAHLDTSFYIS